MPNISDKFKNIGLTENAGVISFEESFAVSIDRSHIENSIEEAAGSTISILPSIEAIHAGKTKNKTFYSTEKLMGDPAKHTGVYSWTHPYCKPILKNHDRSGEPLGRVQSATFVNNGLRGQNAVVIQPKIIDKDAIEKIQNGLYDTVSIGGSTDSLTCNICGTNNIKEWCEHMPGEEYDGVECYFIVGDITFNECSFVNVPADEHAGVINPGETQENSEDANEDNSQTGIEEINAAEQNLEESVHEGEQPEADSQDDNPSEEEPADEEEDQPEVEDQDPAPQDQSEEINQLNQRIAELEDALKERDSQTIAQITDAKKAIVSSIMQMKALMSGSNETDTEEAKRLESRVLVSLVDTFEDVSREFAKSIKEKAPEQRPVQTIENPALEQVGDQKKDEVDTQEQKETPKKKPDMNEQITNALLGKKRK